MTNTYQIDSSHSSANFSVKHMMIAKVHGGFEKLSGTFIYDSANPKNSSIDVTIDAASINTREAQRDAHLKSADFFDIEKYPTLTFKSTNIEKDQIKGNLTIHGVTQHVILEIDGPSEEMKDPWGNTKIAFSGTTKIKRKDFGLTWNAALEAGGLLVADDVAISFDVQLVKQV
jgi:polyisoprenoid-binding protein YceI